MLSYFIIGTALLIALIIGSNALISANPRTILKVIRITALILLSAGAAFLAFTGRFQFASALAFAALFFLRNKPLFSSNKPSPGQTSSVTTEWLDASLDHDSGEMDAIILKGEFAGHSLSELTLEQLERLKDALTIDQESLAILDTFLSRNFEKDDQKEYNGDNSGTQYNSSTGSMSKSEAYDVLGLKPNATLDEIKAAHKKLMKKFHPDHDGSAYMAAKINQARDILIKS